MPIKPRTIIYIALTVIIAGLIDLIFYSAINTDRINYINILSFILALGGGIGIILNKKLGWIFCIIFGLKFIITSIYNLLNDNPNPIILTGLLILAIYYLKTPAIKKNFRINITLQSGAIVTGIIIGLTNILI